MIVRGPSINQFTLILVFFLRTSGFNVTLSCDCHQADEHVGRVTPELIMSQAKYQHLKPEFCHLYDTVLHVDQSRSLLKVKLVIFPLFSCFVSFLTLCNCFGEQIFLLSMSLIRIKKCLLAW